MFDPYYKWLGISPKDQPPNYYRLFSLDLYEKDLDVIEGAADRVMGFVRQYQSGEQAASAAKLLNEIAAARLCLLKPTSKSAYDAKLKSEIAAKESVKDEMLPFDDAELDELVKSSKRAPKLAGKSKKKNKNSKPFLSQPLIVGVAAIVILLTLAAFLWPKLQQPDPKSELPGTNSNSEIATGPATETAAAIGSQAASNMKSESIQNPGSIPSPRQTPARTETASAVTMTMVLPDDAIGPAVDLIQQVDMTRDLVEGVWKKEGSALIGDPGGKLFLPTKLPEDYALRMILRRTLHTDGLLVGFMMSGQQGLFGIDIANSTISGMMLDGHFIGGNCTTHNGPLFQNDRATDLFITVHPGHLVVKVDGQIIIDWHGRADRIVCQQTRVMPMRESLFLVVYASYRVESASLIPLEPERSMPRVPALDSEIDLTKLIEIPRDARKGSWTMSGGVLSSPGQLAQLQIPVDVPEEYTFSATVERPKDAQGDSQLDFGLVDGSSICQIVAFVQTRVGVETIDETRAMYNATSQTGIELAPGDTAKFAFTVTKQGIRCEFNERTLIDWHGDSQRLGLTPDSYLPDARKLFVTSRSNYQFRNLTIGPPVQGPRPPAQSPIEQGHPVDLRRLVDLKRDAYGGTWSMEANKLRVLGDATFCKLMIPCKLPSEYKITMRVGREPGAAKSMMVLNLPIDRTTVQIFFDYTPPDKNGRTFCGVTMDDLEFHNPANPTYVELSAIPATGAVEITASVPKYGLNVTVGKSTVINWTGNPNRCGPHSSWSTPPGGIGICSEASRFRFDKLEIEALKPSPVPVVKQVGVDGDLLAIIDPVRDSQKGDWKLTQNSLDSPEMPGARIGFTALVPERYVLSTHVQRKTGTKELTAGLVIGGHPCSVSIDANAGVLSGIGKLDGLPLSNETNRSRQSLAAPSFPIGKSVHVQYFVLRDSILVKCDDQVVIKWHGDPRRLSSERYYPATNDLDDQATRYLWLGTSESVLTFRDLTLKSLTDDEAASIEGSF